MTLKLKRFKGFLGDRLTHIGSSSLLALFFHATNHPSCFVNVHAQTMMSAKTLLHGLDYEFAMHTIIASSKSDHFASFVFS